MNSPDSITLWRTSADSWAASHSDGFVRGTDAQRIYGMLLVHDFPATAIAAMRLGEGQRLEFQSPERLSYVSPYQLKNVLAHPPSRRFMLEGAGSHLQWWLHFTEDDLQPEEPQNDNDVQPGPELTLHSPILDPKMMLASIGKAALLITRFNGIKNLTPAVTRWKDIMSTAILYGYPESASEIARRIGLVEVSGIRHNFFLRHRSMHFWRTPSGTTTGWKPQGNQTQNNPAHGNLIAQDPQVRDAFLEAGRQPKGVTPRFIKVLGIALSNGLNYPSGPWNAVYTQQLLEKKTPANLTFPPDLDERHILDYTGSELPAYLADGYPGNWDQDFVGALILLHHRYKPGKPHLALQHATISNSFQNSTGSAWYSELLHGYHLLDKETPDAPTPEQAWNLVENLLNGISGKARLKTLNEECKKFTNKYPNDARSEWYKKFQVFRASTLI